MTWKIFFNFKLKHLSKELHKRNSYHSWIENFFPIYFYLEKRSKWKDTKLHNSFSMRSLFISYAKRVTVERQNGKQTSTFVRLKKKRRYLIKKCFIKNSGAHGNVWKHHHWVWSLCRKIWPFFRYQSQSNCSRYAFKKVIIWRVKRRLPTLSETVDWKNSLRNWKNVIKKLESLKPEKSFARPR